MIFFTILVDHEDAVSGAALSRNEMWDKIDKHSKMLKEWHPKSKIEVIVDDSSMLIQNKYNL